MRMSDIDFVLMHLDDHPNGNLHQITFVKSLANVPLYVFSTDDDPDVIASYLEHGSEGHIGIPFDPKVTASRLKAVLRFLHTVQRPINHIQRLGRLHVYLDNREVSIDGHRIQLTEVEFKIVKTLIENRDVTVSKDRIIHAVWNNDDSATDNALGIHITRLRKKLKCADGEDLIETVWGLGYRLNVKRCETS